MKWFLFGIIVFNTQLSLAQTRRDSIRQTVKQYSLGINVEELRNKEISAFADSINQYTGGSLPNFLFDECLDWNASYWPNMHSATSVRWMVLEKVNNKAALKLILNSGIPQLKLRCRYIADTVYPYLAVPGIKKSFFQLIRKRYRQL